MSSLDDYLRRQHQVRKMRGTPTLHADDAAAVREHASDHVVPFAVPRFPARRVNGVVAASPVMDAHRRVGLTRIAKACGWGPGTQLLASGEAGVLELEPVAGAAAATGWTQDLPTTSPSAGGRSLRVDAQCRITLDASMCFTLGIAAGDQLLVVSEPDRSYAVLASLTHFLDAARIARLNARIPEDGGAAAATENLDDDAFEPRMGNRPELAS